MGHRRRHRCRVRSGRSRKRSVFDVVSSQPGFEIIPGSSRSATMTKKGAATDLDVEFVQIRYFVVGRLFAKGTFSQYDVRGGGSRLVGQTSVSVVAILQNVVGCHVETLVVSTHKYLVANGCVGIPTRQQPRPQWSSFLVSVVVLVLVFNLVATVAVVRQIGSQQAR